MKQFVLVLNLKVAQVSEKLWNKKKRSKSKAILNYFWHSIALSSGSKFHFFGYDLSTLFKLGGNESKGMCSCTPMSKPCSVCGSLSFPALLFCLLVILQLFEIIFLCLIHIFLFRECLIHIFLILCQWMFHHLNRFCHFHQLSWATMKLTWMVG